MPKCEVIGVANQWPDRSKTPYYNHEAWLESLRRFDAAPSVIGLGEPFPGLITIPRQVRKWLRAGGCKCKYLIFSNCFDVIFTAHPDEVAERWGGGEDVMFNCEKDLFPASNLAHRFPDTGSPWRYLNSGLYIGKPDAILAMLEAMWLDQICDDHIPADDLHGTPGTWTHVVDQNWFQLLYAAQPVPITLDTQCKCFQTFSACTWDEFDLSKSGKVINKITGTTPLVLHCNGGAKNEMLPDLCRKFGLKP